MQRLMSNPMLGNMAGNPQMAEQMTQAAQRMQQNPEVSIACLMYQAHMRS